MTQTYDVAIIGAGAAGIAAARHLAATSLSVLVLEASGRLGGRAHTETIRGIPMDLGCGWLHSAERNVWREIAEASGLAVERTPNAWGNQFGNLGFSPEEQQQAWQAFGAWSARLETDPPPSDIAADALEPGGRWNATIEAISGYINGVGLAEVSVADYLAYDTAASDNNWRVRAGYGALVAASLPAVPVRLATPVTEIDHTGRLLRIETAGGTIACHAAIVTVSTNVLAGGGIRFRPSLDAHLHAAACLPLGLANKVFLAIDGPSPFEPDSHVMGNPYLAETGGYSIRPLGRDVIECYFGGPGAQLVERAGLEAAIGFAKDELAALFGADVRRCLRALAVSNWGQADWIGGSYSHALPGQSGARALLAQPVEGRLLFAGEATHAFDFSTAHGAYASGVRAAEQAIAGLAGSRHRLVG
jgi:monoamine oxidase